MSVTCGSTAKFQAGGGEAVDPLQRAAVPWVRRRLEFRFAVANRHHKLDHLADDASENDDDANRRRHQSTAAS